MKTKILIVEDDPNIRFGLEEVLQAEGFLLAVRDRGDQAIDAVIKERPALVLLDIMLPGKSGYDICKELRQRKSSVLILMLTAKGQEIERVVGLDLGADDYLTKPFGVRELVARVKALLRRASALQPGSAPFKIGESLIDPKTMTLSRGDLRERLTAREMHLLQIFHQSPEEVFSRDRLLAEVWGYEYYGTTRTLDQVIVQLRKKLGESGEPKLLLTVHGVGYRLREEPKSGKHGS
jgi:two-component system, OmpR family, alkaline phosphatase synthesis response regulator PhoP